jgi:hypothetical protein
MFLIFIALLVLILEISTARRVRWEKKASKVIDQKIQENKELWSAIYQATAEAEAWKAKKEQDPVWVAKMDKIRQESGAHAAAVALHEESLAHLDDKKRKWG